MKDKAGSDLELKCLQRDLNLYLDIMSRKSKKEIKKAHQGIHHYLFSQAAPIQSVNLKSIVGKKKQSHKHVLE